MRNQVTYLKRTPRIIIAALASFYILFHGRSFDIVGALKTPFFYIAFAVTFIVALVLVKWIHYTTLSLDKYNGWFVNPTKRLIKQVIIGIVIPLVFDFALLSIYFYFLGTNIFENGFIRYDFPVIICFIIMLNLFYAIIYFKNSSQVSSSQHINRQTGTNAAIESSAKIIHQEGLTINNHSHLKTFLESVTSTLDVNALDIELDILYFYSFNKQVFIVTGNGGEFTINTNLNLIDNLFSEVSFARINRSVVLNLKTIVEGFENGEKRDTLSLIFFPRYNFLLKERNKDFFVVTKHYMTNVKDFFHSIIR